MMKNVFKTIKKINVVLLTLIVLFNSVSFGALISDNDGSAFITKSEFDSLKNDFQSKLNEFNVGMDNKIDVAIAAYLAGISLASQQKLTNLITAAKKSNAKNVGFMLWATPKSTRSYGNDYCDVEAGYGVAMCYGMQQPNNQAGSGLYGGMIINNVSAWNASVGNVQYVGTAASGGAYTGTVKSKKSAYYWVNFPFASNTSDWTLKDNVRHRLHMILQAERVSSRSAQSGSYASSTAIPTANIANNATITSDFTSLKQPGMMTSATQATIIDIKIEPALTQTHAWSQFDKDSDFTSENDATTNKHLDYQIAGTIPSEIVAAVEYKNRDYYATAKTLTIMAKPPTASGAGSDPGYSQGLVWKGTPVATLKSWSGRTNNITFSWKFNYPKYYGANWQRLTTAYYNDLFVKPYYKYYGIPITNVTKEGTLKFTLRFNNSTSGNYTYCIMDKTFANGALPTTQNQTLNGKTYNRVLNRATVTGTSGNKDVEFTINKEVIWDSVNGDYIYVKVQPAAAGQVVTVDCTKDIILESKK